MRKELDRALELQAGMRDSRKNVLDMTMNEEVRLLRQQLESVKREKETLEKENIRLREALGKKNFNKLKNSFKNT